MSTLQTLIALVVLIFVLSVMVQALQELVKSALDTKAGAMEETIDKFMGNLVTLPQVQSALTTRGLDITALEHFNKDDFRKLLDGIDFGNQTLQGLVANATASLDQKKDNIAAAYEGARAKFQKLYAAKNKRFAVALSFIIVLALNANLLMIYQELSADQAMTQAVAGKASTILNPSQSGGSSSVSVQQSYQDSRDKIMDLVAKFPPLVRDSNHKDDFGKRPGSAIIGLILMGLLVSLGAPFWNDVLKGITGVNNALNTNGKKTS